MENNATQSLGAMKCKLTQGSSSVEESPPTQKTTSGSFYYDDVTASMGVHGFGLRTMFQANAYRDSRPQKFLSDP